jgi:hypothetical protein
MNRFGKQVYHGYGQGLEVGTSADENFTLRPSLGQSSWKALELDWLPSPGETRAFASLEVIWEGSDPVYTCVRADPVCTVLIHRCPYFEQRVFRYVHGA